MRFAVRAALAVLSALACAATPASSEEGMWTFDNFPARRMLTEMGWAPDQAWLDRVMAGTARMPGCSASSVSSAGLVLTNHHCVIACLNALSGENQNLLETGFAARRRTEERRCPSLSLQLLERIEDVTGRIDIAATLAGRRPFALVRDETIARIVGECEDTTHYCEVVTLYQGGRYALYRYRRYNDVRVVFAPEHAIAAFGGEADNFEFPRTCLDLAFLRVYDNGAPAATPNHLSMRFTPLTENEVVLISGNPGPTARLRTTAEMAFERDVNLAWQIETLTEASRRIEALAASGGQDASEAAAVLQTTQNLLKGLTLRRAALADTAGFAIVAAREADLQQRVRRNRAAQREVGDAWAEIARAQTTYHGMFYRFQLLEQHAGERSALFSYARDLVRAPAERALPNGQRLPRYTNARLDALEQFLRTSATAIDPALEQIHLEVWLTNIAERLGADPAARAILGGETPAALAQRLSTSRLADPDFRMALWRGGAQAIAATDDPMIVFVRAWDAEARAVQLAYVQAVELPVALARERIARARFRAFSDTHYPEATFTPRLSYGRVRGWAEADGRGVATFTRMSDLFARATAAAPFALPQTWRDAQSRIDPGAIVNVVTTTDVISGNSGSPLLDQEGRVVGVVFDGNTYALGGEYYYDGARNRSITVAATAIRTAVADVYGVDALLSELGGR